MWPEYASRPVQMQRLYLRVCLTIFASVHIGEGVVKGSIHVRYADGRQETVRAGDVYYWPPGNTVHVDEDYEALEFSPAGPMTEVIAHLNKALGK